MPRVRNSRTACAASGTDRPAPPSIGSKAPNAAPACSSRREASPIGCGIAVPVGQDQQRMIGVAHIVRHRCAGTRLREAPSPVSRSIAPLASARTRTCGRAPRGRRRDHFRPDRLAGSRHRRARWPPKSRRRAAVRSTPGRPDAAARSAATATPERRPPGSNATASPDGRARANVCKARSSSPAASTTITISGTSARRSTIRRDRKAASIACASGSEIPSHLPRPAGAAARAIGRIEDACAPASRNRAQAEPTGGIARRGSTGASFAPSRRVAKARGCAATRS